MATRKSSAKTTKKVVAEKVTPPELPIITEDVLTDVEQRIVNGEIDLAEAVRLFGFQIGERKVQPAKSFALPQNDDGASTIQAGGVYGTYIDLEGTAKNEVELITRYREASLHPECASAIDDIVDEAIVDDGDTPVVSLNLDKLNYSDNFKDLLHQEFQEVLDLLNFDQEAYEIFKRWYVDGRLYYHIMIDPDNPQAGITELRFLDPRRVRKVKELKKSLDPVTGAEIVETLNEYYVYNERGINNTQTTTAVMGVKVAPDAICFVHSGLIENARSQVVLSYLHKALKFLNQLRHIEDAVVIYRLSRAPERRIFYIDVGQMPKIKAEQYLRDIMLRYRNKLVYDANTGEVRDDKKYLSMMEDYWLPRREGTRGTEISTLPGGENLGEMADVEYFEMKLYRSLGVPISRLKSEGGFNLGRSTEINRDEEKFSKFVKRLRKRFTFLFDKVLSTNLRLKGVVTQDEWEQIRNNLSYKWAENSYYAEMRENEALQQRLSILMEVAPFLGVFYSRQHIMKNILKMSMDDIKQMDREIQAEQSLLPSLLATQMQAQQLVAVGQQSVMQQSRYENAAGMMDEK